MSSEYGGQSHCPTEVRVKKTVIYFHVYLLIWLLKKFPCFQKCLQIQQHHWKKLYSLVRNAHIKLVFEYIDLGIFSFSPPPGFIEIWSTNTLYMFKCTGDDLIHIFLWYDYHKRLVNTYITSHSYHCFWRKTYKIYCVSNFRVYIWYF